MGTSEKEYVVCKVYGNGKHPESHGYFKRANGDLVYRVIGEVQEGQRKGEILAVDLLLQGDERALEFTFEAFKVLGIDPQTTEDPSKENIEGKRFSTQRHVSNYQSKTSGEWVEDVQGRGLYAVRVKQQSFLKKQEDLDKATVEKFWGKFKQQTGNGVANQSTNSKSGSQLNRSSNQTVTQSVNGRFQKPGSKVAHKDLNAVSDAEFFDETPNVKTQQSDDEEIPF